MEVHPQSPPTEPTSTARASGWEAMAAAALVAALLLFLAGDYAVVWDEGYTFERIERLERLWKHPQWMLDPQRLDRDWRFSREEPDGHGPVYALLSVGGHRLSRQWLDPPQSYRLGSILLFSIAAGATYWRLRIDYGRPVAVLALALLATTPRLVPEVCYALYDGPLAALALLSWSAFLFAIAGRRWGTFVFGVSLGLALATKFTGFLLPLPYLLFAFWQRQRRTWECLLTGGVLAALVLLAVNVGWWHDPVGGLRRFLESNLTRAETIPIPIQFFGHRYPFSLPWYNSLAWMALTLPVGTLCLAVAGIVWGIQQRRQIPGGLLASLVATEILLVRALPIAPGHDGTRQLVIALAFAAVLAAIGFAAIMQRFSTAKGGRYLVVALAVATIAESALALRRYHPRPLSYYSPLVGGLAGAARQGMEPTYYWDAVDTQVLDWLTLHTSADRCVLFRNYTPSWNYLRRWGKLPVAVCSNAEEMNAAQWLVLQNRPGLFTPSDEWLLDNAAPAAQLSMDGVWMIRVYAAQAWHDALHKAPASNRKSAQ